MNHPIINIIGIKNSRYDELLNRLRTVLDGIGLNIRIQEENDLENIFKNKQIHSIPAIEVNGEIICQNSELPRKEQLSDIFKIKFKLSRTPKKILVPLDLSKDSESSLKFALQLAKVFDAEINVVNVIQPSFDESNPYFNNLVNEMYKTKTNHLKWIIENTAGAENDVKIKPKVLIGNLKRKLVDYINSHEFDLVVLNMKKHNLFYKIFFGSVSSFISKNINTDLVLVPSIKINFPIESIAFISKDFNKEKEAITRFLNLAETLNANTTFFNLDNKVNEDQTRIQIEAIIKEEKMDLDFELISNVSISKTGLEEHLNPSSIDLLVLAKFDSQNVDIQEYTPNQEIPFFIFNQDI